ncbi:SIMPL domain-containing protein [Terrimonas sp. NA20]|uniref:SIMPL domain-containing protein n=1 Tax=Terrimonas ginsenosidimutans TaxID=2908004 RepID=A0ABS9KK03_9BACT|nr:SIMPL domain-containing protein [Terrimonas ginsenosidimutans]MCG2612651.1 SIMPL domain-containing protein [Terrimonas ginsenosidimutans]
MKKPLLSAAYFLAITSIHAQQKNFIDQPYLEVTGSADSLVTPNQIFIRIFVSEKDTKDRIPLEDIEVKMVKSLSALGINTENQLQVSDMLSNYKYFFLKKRDILKTKEYMLEVNSASLASDVFIELEKLDISNASIDRVDHTQIEAIKNICRGKAIAAAKQKALALTKPLGQDVGTAIHIVDTESISLNQLQGKTAGIQIRGVSSNGYIDKSVLPTVDFQKIKVTSGVTAAFVLK